VLSELGQVPAADISPPRLPPVFEPWIGSGNPLATAIPWESLDLNQ
jgi:hypothetical protein